MVATRIADAFDVQDRFLRSVHLERDFLDENALRGYVVTPQARSNLERLARGLSPRSGQRAWRITGDYGTGKSSFALALAHLLGGREERLPQSLRQAVNFRKIGLDQRPELLPVLVTGSREPLTAALLRSLSQAIERTCQRGVRPRIIERARSAAVAATQARINDVDVIQLVGEAVGYVRDSGKGSGILVVLDELGKFLEFAALHPYRQDVFFLQSLAEAAARSGQEPLFVVGLLHQGFSAYAEQLSQPAQKEWEKIAGRFEELLFTQPLEQTAGLVADALKIRTEVVPRRLAARAKQEMARALDLGWYGVGVGRQAMLDVAPRLYPLHPLVLPVLVRLFSRFGQNERSLFSFLLSDEPFALREFSQRPIDSGEFYRLFDLYDYTRAAFGHRLSVQSYRSHWNLIESVVESFPGEHRLELGVLKSVAVLNLVDAPGLLASAEVVAAAVGGAEEEKSLKGALKRLQRDRAILYYRGASGGYCLWPHTSVNLDRAYQEASRALPTPRRVGPLIRKDLETRPLVARRHYIETGNLRHFEVEYTPPSELSALLDSRPELADGRIVVVLCETEAERIDSLKVVRSKDLRDRDELLIAVPSPLQGLANLLQEVQRWEWVSQNVPELNNDAFAAEEVSRQLSSARQVLERRVRSYVGLRQFGETMDLQWFYKGEPAPIAGGRELLAKLSEICDRLYSEAPRVRNELVNRHVLSSAASAARQRLIERMLKHTSYPLLGMDPKGKPPEMSMYLSVLKKAGLHRKVGEDWAIADPEAGDPCNVRPVLHRMLQILEEQQDGRMKVSDLFAQLRLPPYGVRDGLSPLLLAVFAVMHEQDVAFFDDGSFLRHVTGQEFQRLAKSAERIEIQYCKLGGVRAVVFDKLLRLLRPEQVGAKKADILDVVRPLCIFAAQLPAYTHRTHTISAQGAAVRDALLKAEEPATLLFKGLPNACGLGEFRAEENPAQEDVQHFVERLRACLDELRGAYPILVERIRSTLVAAFDRPGSFSEIRENLAATSEAILVGVSEPQLKALCMRLSDRRLGEQEWLESVGSLICSKPPAKWGDSDATRFGEELLRLARHFQRVESTVFTSLKKGDTSAIRVALTRQDGAEVDQVLYLRADEEERAKRLEETISGLLSGEKRVGVAAAARVLWRQLQAAGAHKKSRDDG